MRADKTDNELFCLLAIELEEILLGPFTDMVNHQLCLAILTLLYGLGYRRMVHVLPHVKDVGN